MEKVKNKLGEIEYSDENVITFEEPIPGFEEFKKFIFVKLEREEELFQMIYFLISVDQPEIFFPILPIKLIVENYPNVEEYEPFGIVKLSSKISQITINLKSPVYINFTTNKAKQKILDEFDYPIEYQLFVEEK
ncbi:MAG TPA: flagellar assembly protein FliW [Ignavibacteriales bacterium]|nr:flagellar assembly protein FliW [Ignavibacteriales bacterium]HOL81296.1 flagellar assembly protein FliW [Ignavibacteriales bacterium]HOM66048.1 flagellar assembly protein FliW [Ignavibacteriales bacterium]HPD67540.1 flagellar assembly protein FliW [Ignavibacteriales bacterium]HPP33406.1 flagellar assembly protein FliW [Ignavibacteriales bacterium]